MDGRLKDETVEEVVGLGEVAEIRDLNGGGGLDEECTGAGAGDGELPRGRGEAEAARGGVPGRQGLLQASL